MSCTSCGGASHPQNTNECLSCGESWASCCCPLKAEVESCPTACGITTLKGVAECSESQLNSNRCTIILKSQVFDDDECPYTPQKILQMCYSIVQTSTICKDIPEDWINIYNNAVMTLNALNEPLWHPTEAILAQCGHCEFYLPPSFNKFVALTNDVVKCNGGCKFRKYTYINNEQFSANGMVNVYTIRDNKIIIKDPKSCGCSEPIPSFLKAEFYAKIPKAKSIEECVQLDDDVIMMLQSRIIADSLGVKFDNQLAIQRSLDKIKEYEAKINTYDSRRVQSHVSTRIPVGIRIR